MNLHRSTRRDLLKLTGGALGLGGLAMAFPRTVSAQITDWRFRPDEKSVEASIASFPKPSKRGPNVIILMADQLSPFMCGCYGHRSVKTSTINALAGGGAVFDAAYCPSPICAPSRASMMTSLHVHNHEVWDNAAPLQCDLPTFAHSFSAAGYRTIACGKMHFVGPDQLHGLDERWTQDIYPATFDWTRSNRKQVAINDGQNIDRVLEAGMGYTPDMDYDKEVLFRTEYGLKRIARKSKNDPFMLIVSFTGPHHPYKAPKTYWDLYSDADIDLPDIPEDYQKREHEHVKWVRRHGKFDKLVPDEVCRKARHANLARTTMIDDYLARIVALLGELKMAENTIVVFTTDHGDMLGEHGLWFKNTAYEWSSRVPFIITGPGIPAQRISEPISLLDLGPTLCRLAGIEPIYPRSDGRDMSDLVMGKRSSQPGQAIMENYGEGVWRGWRMIRRGRHKMTYVPGYEPELFNLSKDPNEWNNLANDPASKQIREELETRVLEGWENHAELEEKRYQSEERRIAIRKVKQKLDWQKESTPVPHPSRD